MRVLVTGAAHYLGGELARRLETHPDVEAIFGLDVADPTVSLERTEFVHADTRHSVIAKLVRSLRLDTIIHAAVVVDASGHDRSVHEANVIGTMNVLAACAGAGSPVRRLVVKSSAAVYGSRPDDPSFVRESMAAGRAPRTPLGRDLAELEQLADDYAIRNPEVTVTVLRLGERIGIRDPGALSRYLRLRVVPTVAGFDPRLQFLHEDDAVEALYRAATEEHPGVFNVTGGGVVLLSQAVELAGGTRAPVLPFLGRSLGLLAVRAAAGIDLPPHLIDVLTHGQVLDCSRLRDELGWEPAHDSRSTLVEFLEWKGPADQPRVTTHQELELDRYLRRRRPAGARW
jgi:UDP-glucose 4-epimerase